MWGRRLGRGGSEYMGGCQNSGPFLGTLNIRCRIIIGIQKGTIIVTTTHILVGIGIGWGQYPSQGLLASQAKLKKSCNNVAWGAFSVGVSSSLGARLRNLCCA